MESINQVKPKKSKPLCLCESLKVGFWLCRICGLFPIVTDHVNGYCVFRKSNFWLAVTYVRLVALILQLVFTTDIFSLLTILSNVKSLHSLLSSINNILYCIYFSMLTALQIWNCSKFITAFNHLVPILQEGILCNSALKIIKRVLNGILIVLVVILSVQYIALGWLHYSDRYVSKLDFETLINRVSQNFAFIFYVLFTSLCTMFIGMLGCFENLVISTLQYKPVHPLKDFDGSTNKSTFLGFIYYTLCNEAHVYRGKKRRLNSSELVEYLRRLHEDICTVMYEINEALNPQLLVHTVVELTVLIVHWYAVIIYMAYDFSTPVAASIHILNCFFVVFHTLGLFVFLKSAQNQHNVVHGLANFLLEYSTRVSQPEEHQQIRFFIEKLKLHRPLTASGIFTLDLGIAGPICANILTYVLVALQFDVPKT